jgi:hypothetical protein
LAAPGCCGREPSARTTNGCPAVCGGVDLAAGLTAIGFSNIEVRDCPGWQACQRAMWQEAAALDPGNDPALQSFHDEGMRSLEILDLTRRATATATAPLALTR